MDPEFIGYRLLLAFLIGAAIGLEREIHEKSGSFEDKSSATLGIRTFSLTSLLGAVTGILYLPYESLGILVGVAFFALLVSFYILDVRARNARGLTTEIGLMFTFVLGILLVTDVIPVHFTLAISVGIVLLLSQKAFIKDTVQRIRSQELNAFISFAIIAVAILPFLPNQSYSLNDIPGLSGLLESFGLHDREFSDVPLINPFRTWLYVALITGVNLIGYFMEKGLGQKRGWLVASAAGGFVSSTATTRALAQESRNHGVVNNLVGSAITANLVSFIQIFLLITPVNAKLAVNLVPTILIMIVTASAGLYYFLTKQETRNHEQVEHDEVVKSIIDLRAALYFAGLFVLISIVSQVALILFGKSGFLIATAFGSLIGLDAVMINTAQLVGGTISMSTAILAFVLANAVNLGAKTFYAYTGGSKAFTLKFGLSMGSIIVASFIGYLFSTTIL